MPHPNLRKVVVVFKTHFDLGFTGLPDEVMRAYTGPMFEAVQRTMEVTANEPPNLRYNWTLPAWPLYFLLHDKSVPLVTRQAARKLGEENRLHWHAYPFTTHTAFCGLEDLVRGLHISRKLSEEFGRWPTGAKQTDVPGHTWILPTLLTQAGVKFLHLGCNSGSHAPHVPPFFWWEGPDGSRLLTIYSPGGYGTPLLPPDDWPYDTWLSVQQTVDNHGPHTPEELKQMRRIIEEGAPGVEILFGQLGDFSDSLFEYPDQLNDLPVIPYDLADTWIHGIGTMPREVARVRELRHKLTMLERTLVAEGWPSTFENYARFNERYSTSLPNEFTLARKIAPIIDQAYEQLLLFGEHTWGLDVKSTITRVFDSGFEAARQTEAYQRLEGSWLAKAKYVERAEELFNEALEYANAAMSSKMPEIEFDPKDISPTTNDQRLHVLSVLEGLNTNVPENVLENKIFRIEVDPVIGGIVSLYDKRTGHEWVVSNGEPFAGYRYDLYSIVDIAEFLRSYGLYFQDWFVHDFGKQRYPETSRRITSYARNFTLTRTFLESAEDNSPPTITLTGGKLQPIAGSKSALPEQIIDIKISLNYDNISLGYSVRGKEASPLAESSVVPFPINLPKATFRLGQTGSIIDPARDVADGANHNLWCADWLDAYDDRIGFGIVPFDMPLFSIGDIGNFRFEPTRSDFKSPVYAHLSNTQWGTNFPQWLEGDFYWKLQLHPHSGSWARNDPTHNIRMHYLTENMFSWLYSFYSGMLTPIYGLVLQSIHPRRDGAGVIIRYWDELGEARKQLVSIGANISAVWECDLLERPLNQLHTWKVADHTNVELELRPHSIKTLLIEFHDQPK